MKKNRIILALFIVLFVLGGCLFVSCDDLDVDFSGHDSGHDHEFCKWSIMINPTCENFGLQMRSCDCGYIEYLQIEPTGHMPVIDEKIEATCEKAGKTEGSRCFVCNSVIKAQETIEAKGHTIITISGENATCEKEGKTDGCYCAVCNVVIKEQETIEAKGHTLGIKEAVEPTCHSKGKTIEIYCKVCKAVIVESKEISEKPHSYGDGEILEEPTCIENGVKSFSCLEKGCTDCYKEEFSLKEFGASEIYEQAVKYTGIIISYDKKGNAVSQGSAVVYSNDGKIITNFHVIENAYAISFLLGDKTYSVKSVLAFDEKIDLAVLNIDAEDLTCAVICDKPLTTGEIVYAVGAPRGMYWSVSAGIISYANRVIEDVSYVQHDASITHGNSGGALINKFGEVVGINTWGIEDSQNLNFAVFVKELDNLKYDNELTVEDFYALQYTANDKLYDWLKEKYNLALDNCLYYKIDGKSFVYAIGYDYESEICFLEGIKILNDGSEVCVQIDLSTVDGEYLFYARSSSGGIINESAGKIKAADYTENTLLTLVKYEGNFFNKDKLTKIYSEEVFAVIEWFAYCIDNYIEDLTLSDFGFYELNFNYDYSEAQNAISIVLEQRENYDSNYYWYEISKDLHLADCNVYFSLYYKDGGIFASVGYFYDDGSYWYAYLRFGNTYKGNFFGCSYSKYENGSYKRLNEVNGYLQPETFTSNTVLVFDKFDGTEQTGEDFAESYSVCVCDLLNFVATFIYTNNLKIDLADLGFIFYDYTLIEWE